MLTTTPCNPGCDCLNVRAQEKTSIWIFDPVYFHEVVGAYQTFEECIASPH
jgi:hypothetical protein